jgi:activated RNA polymerase II transcriptional coactivator p15
LDYRTSTGANFPVLIIFQLSAKKRVTVGEFKGNTLVNLREYYEKDGKELPGKQGISLTIEQFTALVLAIPDIKKALAGQGFDIDENEDEDEGKHYPPDSDNDCPETLTLH